jgi:hypothetical protein
MPAAEPKYSPRLSVAFPPPTIGGGDPFKATDVASVSKVIHSDNQLHSGQFGKAAYTGWIPSN